MNELRQLFETERKRVFQPDPFFAKRVIARLNERAASEQSGIWDSVPGSVRPVLALALMLILCFLAVEMFVPQMPQRGMVESFLAPEQNPAESFLYSDADIASQDVLEQMIAPEEDR